MTVHVSNTALTQIFMDEVWNKGKAEAIDKLYHHKGLSEGIGKEYRQGPEEFKVFHKMMMNSFDGINMTIIDIIEQGTKVAFRAKLTCRHKKTGKKVVLNGTGFGIIQSGVIIQAWNSWNFLEMLTQLDMVSRDKFMEIFS